MNKHYGNAEKILEAACKTAGYSIEYLKGILVDRFTDFDGLDSIDLGEWCYICSLIEIDLGCFSYGYSSMIHQRRIGKAVITGHYRLAITKEISEITRLYKSEIQEQEAVRFDYHCADFLQIYEGEYLSKLNLQKTIPNQNHVIER